ncbi:hypothetical protein [Thioalbus denitrificans]|uniref:Uncharacterized protein n=1 Tax=Thioalbus denitrificans TaxID=547122 RepID=A0A369BTJ3_9GAMM|nr:hypothetical protein [Thioalbus denitrificans]RCX23896.1 hypothetical protein DFQ59_11722 [Thioalbus denitrificans]
MQVETAWVKAPSQIGGLDHLAVQAPCINIYSRLLPGITNVTDRARYYSFYPWLIWALDQAGYTQYDDTFIERFRRADCLYSLIAERHAITAGGNYEDHAAAMVGSNTLATVASSLDDNGEVRLSDYSLRDGAKARYFLNRLGGLGQYYLGVLRELNILDGDTTRGIKYTRQVGEQIAIRVDAGINRKLFLAAVDADAVTAADLEALSAFCPCQLVKSAGEHDILSDLFFVRGLFYDKETLPRRRTLQSLLQLTELLVNEEEEVTEATFRGCAYTSSLPSGTAWVVPPSLAGNRQKWALYARNEILSIAVQGLFYVLLDAYEASGIRFDASAQVVDWYLAQPEVREALGTVGRQRTFSRCLADSVGWLPALEHWREPSHEAALMEHVVQMSRGSKSPDTRTAIIVAVMRILIGLASRADDQANAYGDLIFDKGYFLYYPINLESFSLHENHTWTGMTMEEVLRWLLSHWGIDLHLRVALRKLRGQSKSTFRIRPSDRGMEVIGAPSAAHSRPRFNQALRVLKDIGALEQTSSGVWQPSALGVSVMELGDAP